MSDLLIIDEPVSPTKMDRAFLSYPSVYRSVFSIVFTIDIIGFYVAVYIRNFVNFSSIAFVFISVVQLVRVVIETQVPPSNW